MAGRTVFHIPRWVFAAMFSVSALPAYGAEQSPSGVMGTWAGPGIQFDSTATRGGEFSVWAVNLTIGPDAVSITYPSLECGGFWTLERITDHAAYYRETLTYGQSQCIDQGLAVVSPMDGPKLRVEFYHPDTVFLAVGHLDRVE